MNNPYSAYQKNPVLTATPEELTLMLYEGAIKFNNQAVVAIEHKQIEKSHKSITKTQMIIDELRATLNPKYPISKQLETLYEYLDSRLSEANIKKDASILEEVNEHIRELRDTWKQAMILAKKKKA